MTHSLSSRSTSALALLLSLVAGLAREGRAAEEIRIRAECEAIESAFRRRTALHWLRGEATAREAILREADPQSAGSVRSLVDDERRFTELDYHFIEKIRNCENRILNRLRVDRFQGTEDVLEAVRGKDYPVSAAWANLLRTVALNFRLASRRGLIGDDEILRELGPRLAAEEARICGTSGHPIAEIAKALWKDAKPDDFPVSWFDASSGSITFDFGDVPEAPDFPRIDLNAATRDELLAVPGLEAEVADAILKYRETRGFHGPEELRLVKEVPGTLLEPLSTVCSANPIVRKKRWTVMVYLNAANNLEPWGIEDMNEMEKIGSTSEVNVVVECARFRAKRGPRSNPGYFFNPYQEHEPEFYWGLDNPPGTRRYYILKDDDPVRVRSALLGNVGEADAGRPEPLESFGRWAVETFPADHYALVIWNHGAGWSGVSYDDNTRHGMTLPDVRRACEGIASAISRSRGGRIDVIEFDACLMATLEVAYELREVGDFLVASQETEPDDGMPYDEYLDWLTKYPESPPLSLAKAMVDTYVRSYAPEGSQTDDGAWAGSETKSAIRLSRVEELRQAVEAVAAILEGKPGLLGQVAEEILVEARRFDRLVDIQDFFGKLAEQDRADSRLREAVENVARIIGYPGEGKDTLVNEVVIRRRSPGAVIWGWNGWLPPPRELAPFVHDSRHAKTPLAGPDAKGNFVARIRFPPYLHNPKSGQGELVREINYRFEDESEKRSISDIRNTFVTTDFTPDAAICAEGHLVGSNRSHGISIYLPAYLGFEKEYRRLRFSDRSRWAALCETYPLKPAAGPRPVGLLGIRHATKADREKLASIVVRDEFRRASWTHDFAAPWREDLGKLGLGYECLRSPRVHGEDWPAVLERYAGGIVVLDNHEGNEDSPDAWRWHDGLNPPRVSGPGSRAVLRYLDAGGHLLLTSPDVTTKLWDGPLHREALGLEYDELWDRSLSFTLRADGIAPEPDLRDRDGAQRGAGRDVPWLGGRRALRGAEGGRRHDRREDRPHLPPHREAVPGGRPGLLPHGRPGTRGPTGGRPGSDGFPVEAGRRRGEVGPAPPHRSPKLRPSPLHPLRRGRPRRSTPRRGRRRRRRTRRRTPPLPRRALRARRPHLPRRPRRTDRPPRPRGPRPWPGTRRPRRRSPRRRSTRAPRAARGSPPDGSRRAHRSRRVAAISPSGRKPPDLARAPRPAPARSCRPRTRLPCGCPDRSCAATPGPLDRTPRCTACRRPP